MASHGGEDTAPSTMAPCLFSCFRKRASFAAAVAKNSGGEDDEEERSVTVAANGPVVVELFSSQGCATSPEAELLFSRIGRGDFDRDLEVPLILLGFHVDYWDYNGWKDPFGCSRWAVRQKAYVEALKSDTLFTPQLVVQGRAQCVGNEQDLVLKSIKSAPRFPALSFKASFEKATEDSPLGVSLTGTLRNKVGSEGANIMVVLFECGLVTQCEGGKSKGKVLANDYVVRGIEKLCEVKDVSGKKTITGTVEFSLWQGFNSSKCGVAILMENGSHQISGSQRIQLPDNL